MRITKSMREYIEKKLNEQRRKVNREACAAYEERRKNCATEIEKFVKECRESAEKILLAYGMDTEKIRWDEVDMGPAVDHIIQFHDGEISNHKESKAFSEAERRRAQKQKEVIDDIIFDAEAGGDKDSLMAAIAAVNFGE